MATATPAERALRDEVASLRAEVASLRELKQIPTASQAQRVVNMRREGRREVLLAQAPRKVPLGSILSAFFGGPLSTIGYIFIAFSSVFVFAFPLNSELVTLFAFAGPTMHTSGTVLGNELTGASVGRRLEDSLEEPLEEPLGVRRALHYHGSGGRGVPVIGVTFTYEVDGIIYDGISYSTGRSMTAGTRVDVEYRVDRPSVARIEGMRYKMFPSIVAFVFAFPLVGLGLVLPRLLKGPSTVRLYRTGEITHGTLVDKRPTGTTVNGVRMMALTFQFQLGGGASIAAGTGYEPVDVTYHVVHKALRTFAVEDEVWEPILYDPAAPARNAALVDGLDGVFIDNIGQIRAHPRAWMAALGPASCVAAYLALLSGFGVL